MDIGYISFVFNITGVVSGIVATAYIDYELKMGKIPSYDKFNRIFIIFCTFSMVKNIFLS